MNTRYLSVLTAVALALLAGSCSKGRSGRDVHYTVPNEVFVLSEHLDRVSFRSGAATDLALNSVFLNNVGHEALIVPAECELDVDAPLAADTRVSMVVGLHTTDWLTSLEQELGLPKVTLLLVGRGGEHELWSVDFASPDLARRPSWARCDVEFSASEARGRTLVVRVEPQEGRGWQARATIGRLIVEEQTGHVALAPFEFGTLEVPPAFTDKLPRGVDAQATFERWACNFSFLERALEEDGTPELRALTHWAVSDQEEAFQAFVGEHDAALFWELWREVADFAARTSGGSGGASDSPLRDPNARPDAVVFVVDCARRDHFSAYGYERETTPRMTELLAERGLVYDNSYSTGTATNFSMPSMMTSRYSSEHRFYATMTLGSGERTLAEELRANGYMTLGITSNPYLVAGSGMDQGYYWYDSMPHDYNSYPKGELVMQSARVMLPYLRWFPTYLYVHLMDVHGPYRPSAPFDTRFSADAYAASDNVVNQRMSPPFDLQETFSLPVEERAAFANVERAITLYDSELAYTDDQVGEYLDLMQESGLFDGAGILLTADHGEEFFEHGFTYHNSIPHEEKVSIPMIIKPPAGHPVGVGVHVGQRVDAVLGVMPTVLALAGIEAAPNVQGENLLDPELIHDDGPLRTILHDNGYIHALHEGDWKLIRSPNAQADLDRMPEFKLSGGYAPMLFDLVSDPGEHVNQFGAESARVDTLESTVHARVEQLAAGVLTGDAKPDLSRAQDEATLERLRALGYSGETPPD